MISWLHLPPNQWIIGDLMTNSPILSNSTTETIRNAAVALKAGHLVAFPTETVYGLGADARNPDAVKRVYEVKGRPTDHPLIVHISSINQLGKWAIEIPDYATSLARAFWPGPMTLILKRSDLVGDFITGGQDTVGLRVPSDPIALALIQEFERISESAIAAPSANRFGQVSATSSAGVIEELEEYLCSSDLVLDGGHSSIGIESTIIDCTNTTPRILRPGFVSKEDVEIQIGVRCLSDEFPSQLRFSGSFEKHYSPKCQVSMSEEAIEGGGFFAMSCVNTPTRMIRLGSPASVDEFARIMYSIFREADRLKLKALVVIPPHGTGLEIAIQDRLRKASMGR
jgi:L-threonylcarbamoyladenylate synthase